MATSMSRRDLLRTGLFAAGGLALTSVAGCSAVKNGSSSSQKEKAVQLVAGTPTPQGDLLADAVDKFAEFAAEESDGSIEIKNLYMALGVEAKLAEAVKNGSADIGQLANGNAATYTTALEVFDLPFLFRNNDALLTALDADAGSKLLKQFATDLGVTYLFPISNGAGRAIETTSKSLESPDDIRGLKIRVTPSVVDRLTFTAWGANPTPMDYSQVYAALQQGVVDGEALPLPIVAGNKHYEVVHQALDLSYQSLFANVFINEARFQSLSSRQQDALMTAANRARQWNYDEGRKRTEDAMNQLKQDGMTIKTPSDDSYDEWASVREDVWNQAASQIQGLDLDLAAELAATR
jgi:TRAP-type C4-dicarboxylate transport system substrate-binding protein